MPKEFIHLIPPDTGTMVYDRSGNRYDGTASADLSNIVNTGKVQDNCMDFAGTYNIDLSSHASVFSLIDACSLSFWVRPGTTTTDQNLFIILDSSDSGFDVFLRQGNIVRVIYRDPITTSQVLFVSTPALSTAVWHHVCFKFGLGGNSFFVNGSPVTATYSIGALTDEYSLSDVTLSQIYVGDGPRNNNLNACIDDFRIYDSPLSAAQVKLLYNAGRGTPLSLDDFEDTVRPFGSSVLSAGRAL